MPLAFDFAQAERRLGILARVKAGVSVIVRTNALLFSTLCCLIVITAHFSFQQHHQQLI